MFHPLFASENFAEDKVGIWELKQMECQAASRSFPPQEMHQFKSVLSDCPVSFEHNEVLRFWKSHSL